MEDLGHWAGWVGGPCCAACIITRARHEESALCCARWSWARRNMLKYQLLGISVHRHVLRVKASRAPTQVRCPPSFPRVLVCQRPCCNVCDGCPNLGDEERTDCAGRLMSGHNQRAADPCTESVVVGEVVSEGFIERLWLLQDVWNAVTMQLDLCHSHRGVRELCTAQQLVGQSEAVERPLKARSREDGPVSRSLLERIRNAIFVQIDACNSFHGRLVVHWCCVMHRHACCVIHCWRWNMFSTTGAGASNTVGFGAA